MLLKWGCKVIGRHTMKQLKLLKKVQGRVFVIALTIALTPTPNNVNCARCHLHLGTSLFYYVKE